MTKHRIEGWGKDMNVDQSQGTPRALKRRYKSERERLNNTIKSMKHENGLENDRKTKFFDKKIGCSSRQSNYPAMKSSSRICRNNEVRVAVWGEDKPFVLQNGSQVSQ